MGKRRIDSVHPLRRRSFLKLAGTMLAAPAIPAAVRFAVDEQLVGEAQAFGGQQDAPTYFVEINLRDQWDFMHVFVPPGIATHTNLIRGESGNMCSVFYGPEEITDHGNGQYLTPDSAALAPHLDQIAMLELFEICTGAIHGHEAVNAIRSPGRSKQQGPGQSEVWLNEPGYAEQGNDYYFSSTPTPASLHNYWSKQLDPSLRNGVTLKYISRFHSICHYGAGLADAELTRIQSVDQLFQTFPEGEDTNILPTAEEAQLLQEVMERVDSGFFDRYGFANSAHTRHASNLSEAAGLWYGGDVDTVSLQLSEEEVAYWSEGVPGQVGDNLKANIWEQAAWAFKLMSNDVTRSVSLEFDYLDVHDTRGETTMNTMGLQCALPLARLIESFKQAGIWDRTLIAVYSSDGGRAPAANSYGNSGKNGMILAGGNIRGGYYGDVGVAGDMGNGHEYNYSVPDPVTGAPQAPVTGNEGRLSGAYAWRTVMKALQVPDDLAAQYPDVLGSQPLNFMLTNV
ncbi:MAG: DUF1501 domain-containing protein [Deltaproteobacteria bacterium]|nr:DUF1501 domain-containing protein [Deltaproteobacteria bacterium]